jgi:preprotein translocase SecE subunit
MPAGEPDSSADEQEREPTVSYRKDQGRYARMLSFWTMVVLVAYGCFHAGGLVNILDGALPESMNPMLVEQFPLLGSLKGSSIIALVVLAACAFAGHRILNRPKIADALIDTEGELHKCTWPGWGETWQGTLAVSGTVLILFLFLSIVDFLLSTAVNKLM